MNATARATRAPTDLRELVDKSTSMLDPSTFPVDLPVSTRAATTTPVPASSKPMDQPLASGTPHHELFSLVEGIGRRGSLLDILVVLSRNWKFGVLNHVVFKSRHNNLKVDLGLPLVFLYSICRRGRYSGALRTRSGRAW